MITGPAKLHPPLREDRDRLAVIEGLADGTLDTLVSDHRPVDTDHKQVPFEQAEPGMVGLESFLSLALSLEDQGVDKARIIDAMTQPRPDLGLESGIFPNARADLSLVDLEQPRKLDAAKRRAAAELQLRWHSGAGRGAQDLRQRPAGLRADASLQAPRLRGRFA